ncbi:hypothetical protein GmHk_14G040737 [Glycine max]|nr:hypothetical protein GmHk_14G040737 [Glycine max]
MIVGNCLRGFTPDVGLDLNQESEALTDSSESRPWDKDTRFEYSFKPMLILYGWSILTKQSDPKWSPYDFI